jgi:hypothetical protein
MEINATQSCHSEPEAKNLLLSRLEEQADPSLRSG